ncbi:glycosyltransferase [Natronorubrum tibetense]|uniref:Glycosyltransferase AglE n=1 Tax=Natronorubrum tibetense GA33 TaxID=1114856 RepID=L9W8C9_9EURY|nr:glycosyltransferase [Natronorubrum tibetense]ELY45775.1 glycosyltransferase AglE [Natronorubrum tibetense GA33]
MDSNRELPLVSVIIPVYNDPKGIQNCLSALEEQTYPDSLFDVIVIDNGSTDETRDIVKEFSVKLLVENSIQGSYAARNKGIEHAKGEILAFTDADCTPIPEWIEAGVSTIIKDGTDLVAGRVQFEFTEKKTAAEKYDAFVSMRNDRATLKGTGTTANLFAYNTLIDEIGLFPEQLQSGGDIYWTRTATNSGFEITYSSNAIVKHPSRNLVQFLKKMYRVGKGGAQLWQLDNQPIGSKIILGMIGAPFKLARLIYRVIYHNKTDDKSTNATPPDRNVDMTIGFHIVAILSIIALGIGRIIGMVGLASYCMKK